MTYYSQLKQGYNRHGTWSKWPKEIVLTGKRKGSSLVRSHHAVPLPLVTYFECSLRDFFITFTVLQFLMVNEKTDAHIQDKTFPFYYSFAWGKQGTHRLPIMNYYFEIIFCLSFKVLWIFYLSWVDFLDFSDVINFATWLLSTTTYSFFYSEIIIISCYFINGNVIYNRVHRTSSLNELKKEDFSRCNFCIDSEKTLSCQALLF